MHPVLYQVNTRCSVQELEPHLRRPATIDDLPNEMIERLVGSGVDYVWLLGVWQTGPRGRQMARALSHLRVDYGKLVPDLRDQDIVSSCFAIHGYEVDCELGGPEALRRARKRMSDRGLRLVLDFVPNHLAIDHPWAYDYPERFINGTEEDLLREPENYVRVPTRYGVRVLAHGRDPNFSGWCDTLQLNYASSACRRAMLGELLRVAECCDGVRCDMAMLLEPEVFTRTWGPRARPADGTAPALAPFWPEAIDLVRRSRPDFQFIAEVYWDMEWHLQQQGFDYTYDKRLYDRLRAGRARPVREHLLADPRFQNRSLRFLENHDESRAAHVLAWPTHRAAAAIVLLVPGMAMLHDGQLEGRVAHIPMQVRRRPVETVDPKIEKHYGDLLSCAQRPEVRRGVWTLWPCRPAWEGDSTWDQFVVFTWSLGERWLLVVVNYGPQRGHGYARIGLSGLRGRRFTLVDMLSETRYERDGDVMSGAGLYLDLPPWGLHAFTVEPI